MRKRWSEREWGGGKDREWGKEKEKGKHLMPRTTQP